MDGITREQLLSDLQAAIEAHPHGAIRAEVETKLLDILRVADSEKLGGLTSKQLAAAVRHTREYTGRRLSLLEDERLVRHERDGRSFLWYIACSKNGVE